jgi:hypothetical protein
MYSEYCDGFIENNLQQFFQAGYRHYMCNSEEEYFEEHTLLSICKYNLSV